MSKCKCNLRTRLVGDGCQHCNPAMHVEVLEQRCEDLEEEIAALRLTDAEREAVEKAVVTADDYHDDNVAATLRGLLERLGGING